MSITRKELVSKYKIAVKKYNELKNKKYDFKITRDCTPFGQVQKMSISDIIKAGTSLHNDFNISKECIKMYGILDSDIKNGNAPKYNGYTVDEWDKDFKLRVEQIHNQEKLKDYETAIIKLEKNFTDEDRFIIEMGEIDLLNVDLSNDEVNGKY